MTVKRIVDDGELPKGAGSAGEVRPVPAASVILLRRDPFEVLMMRRNERSSFVPGAWVFPGGALDESDVRDGDDEERAARRCAVREVFEETGIWLGRRFDGEDVARRRLLQGEPVDLEMHLGSALDDLVPTSRWVTPVGVPKRFDTWFFLAIVDDDLEGTPDDEEGLELVWIRPDDALQRHRQETFSMVFPTIRSLEEIAAYQNPRALVDSRKGATITITQPVLVVENGRKKIVIPGER